MDTKIPSDHPSRREALLAGAGLVVASTILAPGGAAEEKTTMPELRNPRDAYPKPPFKRQKQDPPGLASKMEPRPDHGEKSYKGSGRLTGRKALITGGDSGIGRAAAIAFAREGADVAFGYLPVEEPDAKEVVELIQAAGRKAVTLPGDIRDEAFCKKLVADAVQALGGLDILVNNAAHQVAQASLAELTTEQFDATFKTNVYALFWITKAALPHLPAGAAIINTSSVQAFEPSPNLLDYAQTKSCIASFTKSLAKQLAEKGIRVNAVAPGPFWDSAPTERRPAAGRDRDVRPEVSARAAWTTGRTRLDLRVAGRDRRQLHHRRGIRRHRRHHALLRVWIETHGGSHFGIISPVSGLRSPRFVPPEHGRRAAPTVRKAAPNGEPHTKFAAAPVGMSLDLNAATELVGPYPGARFAMISSPLSPFSQQEPVSCTITSRSSCSPSASMNRTPGSAACSWSSSAGPTANSQQPCSIRCRASTVKTPA